MGDLPWEFAKLVVRLTLMIAKPTLKFLWFTGGIFPAIMGFATSAGAFEGASPVFVGFLWVISWIGCVALFAYHAYKLWGAHHIDTRSEKEAVNPPTATEMESDKPRGVFFGRKKQKYIVKPEGLDGHVMVVGGVGAERQRFTATKYTSTKSKCPLPDFEGDAKDQRSWTNWMAAWLSDARRVCKPGAPISERIYHRVQSMKNRILYCKSKRNLDK